MATTSLGNHFGSFQSMEHTAAAEDDVAGLCEEDFADGMRQNALDRDAADKDADGRLDFEEFCEVTCRICREKLPVPLEELPANGATGSAAEDAAKESAAVAFANSLDTWLGLIFLPALRNAGKGVVLEQK